MQAKLEKLNMVVGAFFSELGNYLLQDLIKHFDNRLEISSHLNVTESWTKRDFQKAVKFADHLKVDVDCRNIDLGRLKAFLTEKRTFLLTLLENPNLLEHDRFTDLLWAVTHLDEELEARTSLIGLPEKDLEHLAVDIQRMYDHPGTAVPHNNLMQPDCVISGLRSLQNRASGCNNTLVSTNI
jgi:hypothetical protein